MHGNNILQTTTTNGTGSLTLASETGFATFASQFAVGEVFKYIIRDATTAGMIETGLGSIDGSGLLVRSVVHATMDSGTYDGTAPTAISLPAGTKQVLCGGTAHSVLAAAPGVWASSRKGYGDMHLAAGAGTLVLTADRAYALPFVAAVDADIDALLCRITSVSGAGLFVKGAIYSVGADGLPGVKLAESGNVAADVTGIRELTFTRFRPPPRFFACLLSNGAPTVQAFAAGVACSNALGFDSSLIPIAFIHHVGAASLTFPSTWTPVGNLSNAARPQLVARCV